MKLINKILLMVLPLAIFGCGDDGGDDQPSAASVTLESSDPANGATDVPVTTKTITLTFSAEVDFVMDKTADFNGTSVSITDFSKLGKVMTLTLPENLVNGTSYTLTVPQGFFLAHGTTAEVPGFTVAFTTVGKKDIDPSSIAEKPVTPDATDEAVALYQYLVSQYGKKVLSASMANVNWNFNEADMVYKATGKYPAIATMDYIHLYTQHADWDNKYWVESYDVTTDVQNWVNNNGILAASWHWNVPTSSSITSQSAKNVMVYDLTTSFKPSNMFVDGTWEKQVRDEDYALITKNILKLQEKGIALIWRPLHEASGKWFWWAREGADVYKKVWIDMFNYFKEAGVKNCIWVWTTQTGYADNSKTITSDYDWYPGDEYVDIIGRDEYNRSLEQSLAEYNAIVDLFPGKMVTLSECGNVSDLAKQTNAGIMWSYAMPWYDYNKSTLDGHAHADTDWWKATMANENVITRDQLPKLK